jgi:hypothetical protein
VRSGLAARVALLEEEKELTRRSDELARRRRELPWVPVEKEYRFDTEDGTKTLAELFDGRPEPSRRDVPVCVARASTTSSPTGAPRLDVPQHHRG